VPTTSGTVSTDIKAVGCTDGPVDVDALADPGVKISESR